MAPRPPRSRQYQQIAGPVFVAVAAISFNVTQSSDVTFKGRFIYQAHVEPVQIPSVVPVMDGVASATSSQLSFRRKFIYQSKTEPAFVPTVETVTEDKWHYPWSEPVRVRVNPQWAAARIASGPVGPPFDDTLEPGATYESPWHKAWSQPVRTRALLQTGLQSPHTEPVFVPEVVSVDKWTYPWSEPVRQKIGLRANLQQTFIAPVLDDETQIIQDFESRWHQPWSEPVRFRRLPVSEYPAFTTDAKVPETITVDKWTYAWSEPVRFRRFPTSEQQAYAAPAFTPEFITTDKWIYPWSEPVRQKIGLKANLQQAAIGPVLDTETQIIDTFESRWHFPWSEPVRVKRQVPVSEQQFLIQGPVQTPEFITVDKWIYAWSEPVRQKIGLKAHLQQALIAPVLDDETQIIQDFESRWHFPWSEPVRVRQPLLTAQQQAVAYQSAFFETINFDKWGFAWSEPVRQKPGIKTHLQQAFIGLTLEPETQIIQTYESRWHFAWSEPVRVKPQVPVGEQQFLIQGPPKTPEFITVDKWIYPWTDPVRQKIGLRASLQQAFIAPVLADEQITGTIESRWHQPWSEPVRFRRFPTPEQQSQIQGAIAVQEVVYEDKWHFPWSEPVRQKPGLRASLQQALIAPILNPETQISQDIESRWHFAWSEPVRFRRFATAEQQFSAAPTTSVFEVITMDKWTYPWSEPVRQKIGLKAHLQQAFIGTTLEPETQIIQTFESRWHQPWSEPLRSRRFPTAEQQSYTSPNIVAEIITVDKWFAPLREPVRVNVDPRRAVALAASGLISGPAIPRPIGVFVSPSQVIFRSTFQYQSTTIGAPPIIPFIDKWGYAWSEPVRQKIGLAARLQQDLFLLSPEPIFLRTIPWFDWLSEPVRQKIGLPTYLQRVSTTDPRPLVNQVNLFLSATEVNADHALFGISVFNATPVVSRVPTTVVSIKEIPAVRTSAASIEEQEAIDRAAVSIEET